MNIRAGLGEYILQTQYKKIEYSTGALNPPYSLPSGYASELHLS